MSRLQTAIFGDLPAFAANPIGFVEERAIGSRSPVKVRFGPMSALLVARPSAIRQVLVDNRDLFGKGAEQARLRPLFGDGMITAMGERWHAARDATRSGFTAAGLNDGLQLAMQCLAQEIGLLASRIGELVPVHAIMARLAMRMAAAALLHAKLDEATTDILYDAASVAYQRLSETTYRLVDFDAILPTPKHRKFRQAIRTFETAVAGFSQNPKGVLGMLRPVAEQYGDRVFIDEAITMLVAGFETTATAASWIAYVLACRPDLIAWLRPEADSMLNSGWGINPASLRDMPRARAFVQEILRLYPSGWWFARTALADAVIDGVSVSKGTSILICPWALHRQPDLWSEPLTLDPMRFFEKGPPEKFAYLPFGAGPRACVGQHLAMAELTAITAMLVSAFELEPLSGPLETLSPFGGVTLGPPPGLSIRLQMRPQLRKVA